MLHNPLLAQFEIQVVARQMVMKRYGSITTIAAEFPATKSNCLVQNFKML